MRRLLSAAFACTFLAGAAPADPSQSAPSGERRESIHGLLAESEFVFQAPDSRLHRAEGPFTLRAIAEDGLRFVASAPPGEPQPHVTVMERDDQIWAHFQFEEDEFLVRLQ